VIKKVVYINYQSISEKYCTDYYLFECLENGLNVEYWDVSNLYFPESSFQTLENANIKLLKFNSLFDFKTEIISNNIDSTLFITNITYEFKVWRLFRVLTSCNCKLAFFARGMFPVPSRKVSSKILKLILTIDFKKIRQVFRSYLALFFKKHKIIKTYDLIFRAGSEGGSTTGIGYHYDLNTSKIVEINYFDYDKYLKVSKESSIFQEDYCVFLDVYLPYHPDVQMMGIKTVSADSYYENLNKYFDFVEKTYNTNVVVCAHPKAQKYKSQNPFNGRKIVFNKTCELVKEAKFAITNYSTSISFPILFKKVIFLISSNEEKEKMLDLYETTIHLGQILNSNVTQFDREDTYSINNFSIDNELYKDYIYKYLTSKESENRFSSEIFIQTILNL
jgi:hypothetical protein